MLSRPSWIDFGGVDRRHLQFTWDDARVYEDLKGNPSAVIEAAAEMSVRARFALLVGLYEWIVWRFDMLHDRQEVKDILEAAWCGTIDPRYLGFFELSREDWVGPVEGPLWCAFTYLEKGFRQAQAFQKNTYQALKFNYLLAKHVLPDGERFERWLDLTLKRLVQVYPVPPDDPYTDVFDERVGAHLGEFIGRDTLDPSLPVDIERDRAFLARILEHSRKAENPFLADEDELQDRSFDGVPYVLPELE